MAKEGIFRGLYAGTVPSLAANVAENSVLFAGYGICQKVIARAAGVSSVTELNTFHNGSAGFLAAFFSSLVLCPTELVKCRLQALRETQGGRGSIGPVQLTRDILRREGVPGLFKGLKPTFAREMPGYFCFFFAYEFCRELFTAEGRLFIDCYRHMHIKPKLDLFLPLGQTKDDIGPLRTIVSGGLAGVTLWTVIFPADVIKSRQQVSSKHSLQRPTVRSLFLFLDLWVE